MRTIGMIVLLGGVLGCGGRHRDVKGEAQDPQPGHPDLVCPPGTQAAGYAPPLSTEVWCQRYTLQGQWVRHGPTIQWWQLYARKATGAYFDGNKNGTWTWWYLDGALEKSETWNQGHLDGPYIEYYENGQKKEEGAMADGHPDGPWTYWTESGNKEQEGAWVDGAMDGPWIIYGPDGQPKTQRTFRQGRLRFQEEL